MGENPSAFFLVKHPIVLGFSGHDAALVSGQGVQPQLGKMSAAVLNSLFPPEDTRTLTLRSKLRTVAAFQVMK